MPRAKPKPQRESGYESTSRVPLGWARKLVEDYYARHPEHFREWTNRRLGAAIGVSHVYVGKLKRELGVEPLTKGGKPPAAKKPAGKRKPAAKGRALPGM